MNKRPSSSNHHTGFRDSPAIVRAALGILILLTALAIWPSSTGRAEELLFGSGAPKAELLGAASRSMHGRAGTFAVEMPLTGAPGVEGRTADQNGVYTAVFTFDSPVTSGRAMIVSGAATAGVPSFEGNEMIVPLTAVENAQFVTIRIEGVNGSNEIAGEVVFGFLTGDANGDGGVDGRDFLVWQRGKGQPIDIGNFQADFNHDGRINTGDRRILQTYRGTSIP